MKISQTHKQIKQEFFHQAQAKDVGSLRYDSQTQAYQGIKHMQANHREAHDQWIPLEFNLMIKKKFHLNSKAGENEGIKYTNHREKYER